MPGKPHPDRYPGTLPGSGWCMSPEPGQCYFLGNYKSHRMKAMTECLGQGGRPCQKVGGGAGAREEGQSLGWFCTDKSLHFSRLEKAVWAVHICRESRSLPCFLALQIFLSFSQTQLVFFMRRAEQTVGSLPLMCSKAHHQ